MSAQPFGQRGYTAVELMMSIGIFGVGLAGVMQMQKVTSQANQSAKNLAIATHIAESWLDTLAADATAWNHPSPGFAQSDLGDTNWLNLADGASTAWLLPPYNGVVGFGPAFDALGNPVNPATNPNPAFCTNIRLTWLYPQREAYGLLRAEVRVFWLRDGQPDNPSPCTTTALATVSAANASSMFHFVQKVTSIRENTQP